MPDEVQVTEEVLAGLVTKLRSLELSDEESAVLGTLLVTAAEQPGEVAGFGVVFEVETTFKGSDEELQTIFRSAVPSRVPRRNAIWDPLGKSRAVINHEEQY